MKILYAVTMMLVSLAVAADEVRVAGQIEVANHQLPALGAADFKQAAPALNPASAQTATRLEIAGLDRNLLSAAIGSSAGDGIRLLHPRWLRAASQRVALGERVFYFLLAPPPPSTAGYAYILYAVEEDSDKPPVQFTTAGEPWSIPGRGSNPVPFNGRLSFAAVPWENSLAVIYRDRGGIFARRLHVDGKFLAFDRRPWQISSAPAAVRAYRILARTDKSDHLHLLWGMATPSRQQSLHYCRITPSGQNACRQPVLVTDSGGSDYANLMLRDDRIYAAWTDDRYASRRWDTLRNTSKLMIATSRDGGQTFSTPVSINRPKRNSDRATFALTLPAAGGGVLVFWAPKRKDPGDLDRQTYRAGWLDSDLEKFRIGTQSVPGRQIFDTYERALLTYHEYLGR